jgi:hypothetical protein
MNTRQIGSGSAGPSQRPASSSAGSKMMPVEDDRWVGSQTMPAEDAGIHRIMFAVGRHQCCRCWLGARNRAVGSGVGIRLTTHCPVDHRPLARGPFWRRPFTILMVGTLIVAIAGSAAPQINRRSDHGLKCRRVLTVRTGSSSFESSDPITSRTLSERHSKSFTLLGAVFEQPRAMLVPRLG